MTLTSGARLGPYEIVGALGAGGMGEVYRARDTRLKRDVAIKVLPEAFARDPERLARFQREAEVLATLNHPNIAAVYGLEEAASASGIVLELVDGTTLADRIARGPIPVDEALAIARQIADAVEAAHEKGIVHRDLKPANIKITAEGTAKVLDFGLAKALDQNAIASGTALATSLPTITSPAVTNIGVILGTAAYMSPEQANGQPVDGRTDIFAFGCVLYEMLTGRRAFPGDTLPEVLAGVLKTEPDWHAVPPDVPPAIGRLMRRCLQKDRRRRLQSPGDARIEIEEAQSAGDARDSAPQVVQRRLRRDKFAWLAAAILVVALAVALGVASFRAPTDAAEMRVEITTPATSDPLSFALSPDGRQIVFVAAADGQGRLWLRSFGATSAQPLAGTEGAIHPFWSPDSRSIGFFAGAKLKRLDIGRGLPETLADASAPIGGAWSSDGSILFAPTLGSPLFRVPASGGDAVAATTLDPPRQISHRLPQFLPDGRQYLFFVEGTSDAQGIYLGTPGVARATRLTTADTAGSYLPPGWLMFVRQGTLTARHIDVGRRQLTADPVTVADPISFRGGPFYVGGFSTSATGLVAYRAGGATRHQLMWFDRSGNALGSLGASDEKDLANLELSADGKRVAVQRAVQNNTDVWLVDAARTTRFTFDDARDVSPVWSPDGSRVAFSSNRKGSFDLYEKPSTSAGGERVLLESPLPKIAADWSPDGRYLLYSERDPKTGPDLWVLPLDGSRKPSFFLKTGFSELWGQFSPDGRWVAYQSDESGRYEIYVRSFPGPGGQWQVSTSGGVYPRWAANGKELYYVATEGRLMSVPIIAKATTLDAGTPVVLFQAPIVGGGTNVVGSRQQYDIAPDGRFLVNVTTEETSPITLLVNWAARTEKP